MGMEVPDSLKHLLLDQKGEVKLNSQEAALDQTLFDLFNFVIVLIINGLTHYVLHNLQKIFQK